MISSALAAHFVPPSESAGGAIALSIILAVAITFLVVYVALKKWRRRKLGRDTAGKTQHD